MRKIYLITLLFFTVQLLQAQGLNIEFLSQLEYSNDLSDIWGYVDGDGTEYALVGVFNGVSIVDLSDPANPVEVAFVNDANSIWRDLKTWGTHAYVTNESSQGLLIIDLSSLPDASGITSSRYTGPADNTWTTAHNIFIDEFGIAYIFGANRGNGGAIFLDLADPENPVEVGTYENNYIHDGMAKDNKLYTGNIYLGTFSVIDVSDKANPEYLGGASTPNEFCHNAWVSDDGNYVYTTDEKEGAFIAGYDLTDINDVVETDRAQFDPGSQTIVHNTHFMNEYLITSYYKAGVTIHDVSDPTNMVMTGHYDTSPFSGGGFAGAWGTYPFLPSGLILVSDIEEGLFVLQPTYTRAARIAGQITDASTGDPIFDAKIDLIDHEEVDFSDVSGDYILGVAEPGNYSVKITKSGYPDTTISNLELVNGEVLALNVAFNDGTFVGINELNSEPEFKVYPNPASDKFFIEFDNAYPQKLKSVSILDITGKLVYKQNVSDNASRLIVDPELENGTYILNLLWDDQRISVNKILITD